MGGGEGVDFKTLPVGDGKNMRESFPREMSKNVYFQHCDWQIDFPVI